MLPCDDVGHVGWGRVQNRAAIFSMSRDMSREILDLAKGHFSPEVHHHAMSEITGSREVALGPVTYHVMSGLRKRHFRIPRPPDAAGGCGRSREGGSRSREVT